MHFVTYVNGSRGYYGHSVNALREAIKQAKASGCYTIQRVRYADYLDLWTFDFARLTTTNPLTNPVNGARVFTNISTYAPAERLKRQHPSSR